MNYWLLKPGSFEKSGSRSGAEAWFIIKGGDRAVGQAAGAWCTRDWLLYTEVDSEDGKMGVAGSVICCITIK